MEPKPRRGRIVVRLLAFLALAAAVVAVIIVVTSTLGSDDGKDKKGKKGGGAEIAGCKPEYENAVELGFYIVQPDDLLSSIAVRTCVEDDELARLNPQLDPQALAPGQCVNLREKGCEKGQS